MRDLVREDACNLRFVRGHVHQSPMDPDRPARQGKRVDLAVVHDREGVGILRPRGVLHEPAAQRADIRDDLTVFELGHLTADLRIHLPANLDLLLDGDETELRADAWRTPGSI